MRSDGIAAELDEREMPCAPVRVPTTLAAGLEGYRWSRDLVGESGGAVYRLHGLAGAPDLFLKRGTGAVGDAVIDEMVRLRWLAGHLPVPAVAGRGSTRDWSRPTSSMTIGGDGRRSRYGRRCTACCRWHRTRW